MTHKSRSASTETRDIRDESGKDRQQHGQSDLMERTSERKQHQREKKNTEANLGLEPACREGFIRIKSYLVLSVYLSVTQFGCDFNILFYIFFLRGSFL